MGPILSDSQLLPGPVSRARRNFPRGLFQPPGSYRFGLDALLLAAFASRFVKNPACVAELGCGCGASLLALALLRPGISGLGFERETELVAAAICNGALLGLDGQIGFRAMDIETLDSTCFNKFNIVIANPPWSKGRPPASRLRRSALAMQADTLDLFCNRASRLLQNRGRFCIILPPGQLCELAGAIVSLRLGLRQILPIASFSGQSAKRALCLLQKNAASDPVILPALTLLGRTASGIKWTEAARNFCPWTGSNDICS